MAIRRLDFDGPAGLEFTGSGAVELLWDDRSVLFIDTETDWTVTVADRAWIDRVWIRAVVASGAAVRR